MIILGKKLLENLFLENIIANINDLEKFIQICITAFVQIAPRKEKHTWQ